MAVDGSLIFNTQIDTSGFNSGTRSINSGLGGLKSSLLKLGAAVGIAFSVQQLTVFGKSCVSAATTAGNALQGLKSIMEGQGRSFSDAEKFINDYVSDGLVPMADAVTAYKNLASRGYNDTQIQSVMAALKDSATYGRQASLTMGEAVRSASEGLKNENSILVDNAGVTKNVSVMWKDYAASLGTTYTNLTKEQKIQAEVNGILTETQFQTGDAAKMANSYSGQVSQLATSFTKFKAAVGDVLINALTPIVAYLNQTIKALTAFMEKYIELLGLNRYSKGTDASQSLSDSMANADTASSGVSDNLSDAAGSAKKIEKSLAGFDDLNILKSADTDTSSTASGASSIGSTSPTINTVVSADTTPAQAALDNLNAKLEPLKASLSGLKDALEPLKTFAAQGLQDFYNNLLVPIGSWVLGEGLPHFIDTLSTGIENVDWEGINKALSGLWDAVTPFAVNVGEGLLWFWDNILVPLGTWTMNEVVPEFLNVLSAAFDTANEALNAVKPLFKWLWDKFLQPIAAWTGGVIVSVLEELYNILTNVGMWIREHQEAFQNILIILGSLALGILAVTTALNIATIAGTAFRLMMELVSIVSAASPFGLIALAIGAVIAVIILCIKYWDEIKAAMISVWESIKAVWGVVADWFKNLFTQAVAGIVLVWTSIIGFFQTIWDGICIIFSVVGTYFTNQFTNGIDGIKSAFSTIGSFFSGVWDGICSIFSSVGGWFKDKFTEAWNGIKSVFSAVGGFFGGLWDTISEKFTSIGTTIADAIGGAFKSAINAVLDVVEGAINFIPNAINGAIGTINDITGLDISPMDNIELPRLARGGIVSSATIAMVGENGREAVMPLENNTGWINELASKISSLMGGGFGGDITVNCILDDRQVGQAVVKYQQLQALKSNGRG